MADGCFLIFCGIPASGKSTLAKQLISKQWKVTGKSTHFIYVNYDDFIPENMPNMGSFNWKDKRRDILNGMEELTLSASSENTGDNVPRTNEKSLNETKTVISKACPCGSGRLSKSNIFHVIVVDDNMYYRSMRYEYYQLARKASFCFAEVYMHCPLHVACSRNASRCEAITQDTIVRMTDRIEKPDAEKFCWEKFNIMLDSSNSETADKWEMILELLENAAGNPLPPLRVFEEEVKAKDRVITRENIIHQADQVIRKHISVKMEQMRKKNAQSIDLKQMAQTLNHWRKKVMEMIKREPQMIIENLLRQQFKFSCEIEGTGVLDEGNIPVANSMECSQYQIKHKEVADVTPIAANDHWVISNSNELKKIGRTNCRAPHEYQTLSKQTVISNSLMFFDNLWDVVSVDEFADIVRNLFEKFISL